MLSLSLTSLNNLFSTEKLCNGEVEDFDSVFVLMVVTRFARLTRKYTEEFMNTQKSLKVTPTSA